jgi:hypothetical protein
MQKAHRIEFIDIACIGEKEKGKRIKVNAKVFVCVGLMSRSLSK